MHATQHQDDTRVVFSLAQNANRLSNLRSHDMDQALITRARMSTRCTQSRVLILLRTSNSPNSAQQTNEPGQTMHEPRKTNGVMNVLLTGQSKTMRLDSKCRCVKATDDRRRVYPKRAKKGSDPSEPHGPHTHPISDLKAQPGTSTLS